MILIVEDPRLLDAAPQRQRECPLHLVLRRMGFHAARTPRPRTSSSTHTRGRHAPDPVDAR
jgi:hypothetical protein